MEQLKTLEYVDKEFESHIIPTLMEYIKIDNLSLNFDPEWNTNGKLEKAANLLLEWVLKQNVSGLKGEIMKLENMSPIIFLEIESNGGKGNTFMYGHFDKQPHFEGWLEGTGPCKPVIIGDLLYGRGGADDGYAIFSSVLTIKALQTFGVKHGKFTVVIEGSEESGSPHLFPYLDKLNDKIGVPDLMVCLDSGCKDYERLWITTSLRGMCMKDVTVECMKDSIHSGVGTGHAPDSFTVIRQLLDRLEDSKTGKVCDKLQVKIPESKYEEGKKVVDILGKGFCMCKMEDGVELLTNDPLELYLNGTWRSTLCVVGQTGLPRHDLAGNVLRSKTSVRLSMRLPPSKDPKEASKEVSEILLKDPPYNSKITVEDKSSGPGWACRDFSKKLTSSFEESSQKLWKNSFATVGEGGSIPFINGLANQYPNAEFIVMGVLGPGSNAHAANETLHIPYCKKVTTTLIHCVYDYFNN